jgi:hypothetical protein
LCKRAIALGDNGRQIVQDLAFLFVKDRPRTSDLKPCVSNRGVSLSKSDW